MRDKRGDWSKKGVVSVIVLVVAGLAIMLAGCKTTSRQVKSNQQTDSQNVTLEKSDLPLVGTKWLLVELRGQSVAKNKDSKEVFYLQLAEDGKVTAFAGCNRMSGGYELKEGLQIRFTAMASTRMACPDMTTEQVLGEVLAGADNYSINGQSMTLNKARMAPLAKFEAEK